MELTELAALAETMESVDDQSLVETPALPNRDWLKGIRISQEKLNEVMVPSGLSVAGIGVDRLPIAEKIMYRLDSIHEFPEEMTSVTIPEILGSSKDLIESVVTGYTIPRLHDELRGFQDRYISAAMPADFGPVSFVREMTASVNLTAAWADRLQVYREEVVGFGDSWIRRVKPMLERSKSFADLYWKDNERLTSCCMKLGHRGWFLDPQMPMSLLWHIADTIEESPQETDELLMQWFQERLDEIEEELIKACPRRALLLRSAFKAHRERDYNNSVVAFLKEADGMWHDLFGMNVFIAPARKSIVNSIKQKQPYGLVCTSLVPLLQSSLPLWMNESERHTWMKKHQTDSFPGLNRHVVVHGISVDYGTEKNSLKAISFLNWRLLAELVIRDIQ